MTKKVGAHRSRHPEAPAAAGVSKDAACRNHRGAHAFDPWPLRRLGSFNEQGAAMLRRTSIILATVAAGALALGGLAEARTPLGGVLGGGASGGLGGAGGLGGLGGTVSGTANTGVQAGADTSGVTSDTSQTVHHAKKKAAKTTGDAAATAGQAAATAGGAGHDAASTAGSAAS